MPSQRPLKRVTFAFSLAVFIKKNKKVTKFKVRKGRYLITFKTEKPDMAKRLLDSLDNNQFEKVEIHKKRVVAKKAKK
jgi:hypothetical protein